MADETQPTTETTQQRPPWLQAIIDQMGGGGYTFTPEDTTALANAILMGQFQQQFGQQDLANRQLDQQLAEQRFTQEQYFPWYTGEYFDFQKQQAGNEMAMSNNQVQMSADDVLKAANYLAAARYGTEQARYGAQAARDQYYQSLGIIPPSASIRERERRERLAATQKRVGPTSQPTRSGTPRPTDYGYGE